MRPFHSHAAYATAGARHFGAEHVSPSVCPVNTPSATSSDDGACPCRGRRATPDTGLEGLLSMAVVEVLGDRAQTLVEHILAEQ